jgi:hypothetical protein
MTEHFSISDPAVKSRVHHSAMRIDLEHNRHRGLVFEQ